MVRNGVVLYFVVNGKYSTTLIKRSPWISNKIPVTSIPGHFHSQSRNWVNFGNDTGLNWTRTEFHCQRLFYHPLYCSVQVFQTRGSSTISRRLMSITHVPQIMNVRCNYPSMASKWLQYHNCAAASAVSIRGVAYPPSVIYIFMDTQNVGQTFSSLFPNFHCRTIESLLWADGGGNKFPQ